MGCCALQGARVAEGAGRGGVSGHDAVAGREGKGGQLCAHRRARARRRRLAASKTNTARAVAGRRARQARALTSLRGSAGPAPQRSPCTARSARAPRRRSPQTPRQATPRSAAGSGWGATCRPASRRAGGWGRVVGMGGDRDYVPAACLPACQAAVLPLSPTLSPGRSQAARQAWGMARAHARTRPRTHARTTGSAPGRQAKTGWPARFFLPLSTRWPRPGTGQALQPSAPHWSAGLRGGRGGSAAAVRLLSWLPRQWAGARWSLQQPRHSSAPNLRHWLAPPASGPRSPALAALAKRGVGARGRADQRVGSQVQARRAAGQAEGECAARAA